MNLRPSYQREYVWTTRTASRLIESLLLNVPIPTMFFHETNRGNMEVVDGKQRLTRCAMNKMNGQINRQ